ncbi:hypothetical protein SynBMKMC1_02324 [Synechococcus sp. BMK-MC-1]|nr:hypothetical protein SynBMKMC1_02324 [Synechococcus sp. BMK-MC-1]
MAGSSLALMGIGKASSVLARLRGQPGIQAGIWWSCLSVFNAAG